MVVVDLVRAAVLAVLTLAVVTGHVSIAGVLTGVSVLSTAEVFADDGSPSMPPVLLAPVGTTSLLLGAVFTARGRTACFAVLVLLVERVTTVPRRLPVRRWRDRGRRRPDRLWSSAPRRGLSGRCR